MEETIAYIFHCAHKIDLQLYFIVVKMGGSKNSLGQIFTTLKV